jgi:hypothetical protein
LRPEALATSGPKLCARRGALFGAIPVKKSPGANLRGLPQSSSRSRRTASLSGFLDFNQVLQGPLRYGASMRFDTMPSNPKRQACSNTIWPSSSRCSVSWMAPAARARREPAGFIVRQVEGCANHRRLAPTSRRRIAPRHGRGAGCAGRRSQPVRQGRKRWTRHLSGRIPPGCDLRPPR